MRFKSPYLLTIVVVILAFSKSIAQMVPGQTLVTIRVSQAYVEPGSRPAPSWKVNNSCLWRNSTGWMDFNQNAGFLFGSTNQTFAVPLEAWLEDSDCHNRCSYESNCGFLGNDSDDGRLFSSASFSVANFAPGIFNNIPEVMFGRYGVRILVSYSTPVPEKPGIVFNGTPYDGRNLCSDQEIRLAPAIQVNSVFNPQIDYSWEYHIDGDDIIEQRERCIRYSTEPGFEFLCEEYEIYFVTIPVWRTLNTTNGGTNGGENNFQLSNLTGLENITESKRVFFRVSATANGSLSGFSPLSDAINLNPPAPTASLVHALPSCYATPTGTVIVDGIDANFGTARYILKAGLNSSIGGCNPENAASCLPASDRSGTFTNLSSATITDVPAGDYTLFLFNNGGTEGFCPSSGYNVTVAANPPLALSAIQPIAITCNGSNAGAVVYTVLQGNTSNINHALSNSAGGTWNQNSSIPGASISFSSLPPGTYTLSVNDGCSFPIVNSNMIITEPARVLPNGNSVGSATCYAPIGASDGAIQVYVSKTPGGSSDYHYQLFNNGTLYNEIVTTESNYTWQNLPAGNNYSVIVGEPGAIACNTWSSAFSVPGPAPLSISNIQSTPTTCYGYSNGSLTFDGNGGTGLYLFELTPSGGATMQNTNGIFSGLPAADYQLMVRSALTGCTDYYTNPSLVAVGQPAAVAISLNKTDVTCLGRADGSITASVSGGTPGYYYQWEMNTEFGWDYLSATTNQVIDLAVGSYRLTSYDQNGCLGNSSEIAIQNPEPTLLISNIVTTPATCYGSTDGAITFDGSGGTGQYIYELNPLEGEAIQQGTGVFTGLLEGQYRLLLRNAPAGCIDYYLYPDLVTVGHSTDLAVTLDETNISCFGFSDGRLSAVTTGGAPGYSYLWEINSGGETWNSIGLTTFEITGLALGTYRVITEDATGCRALSPEATITEPLKLEVLNADILDIKCIGSRGRINPIATGGTPPYTFEYSLVNTPFAEFTASTDFGPGEYYLRAIDGNGCVSGVRTAPFFITNPPRILDFTYALSNYNGVEISCYGGNNGFVEINATGGNGAPIYGNEYLYALEGQPYSAAKKIENLSAGTYTVKVKDLRNCEISKEVTLRESPNSLEVDLVERRDVICPGDKTGRLEASAKGGSTPYQFSLENGPLQGTGLFTNLGIGNYVVKVIDKNNCTTTRPTLIASFNTPMDITAEIKDIQCFGVNDGTIKISATGGTLPLQYTWRGLGTQGLFISNLSAGNYIVDVRDGAGCTKEATFKIVQPSAALSLEVASTPACYGHNGGQLSVLAKGGTTPYQYSIDGSNFQTAQLFSSIPIGDYTVKVKDNNNCLAENKAKIIQRSDRPAPNFLVATKRYASDTLIAKDISQPKPDSIEWQYDSHAIVVKHDQWSPELMFNEAGTYTMGMKGYFGGCDYDVTKTLNINPFDPEIRLLSDTDHPAIEELGAAPNPSTTGEFMLTVKLSGKQNIFVTVMDVQGTTHYKNSWESVKELRQRIDLNNIASGLYVIQVLTQTEAKEVRMMISR